MKGAMKWLRGFLEQNAPQSMTRGIALLCGVVGCLVSLAGILLSHRDPLTQADVAMAHELYLGAAVLIGGGAVALLTRSPAAPQPPAE